MAQKVGNPMNVSSVVPASSNISFLSPVDLRYYLVMRQQLSSKAARFQRNRRLQLAQEQIAAIKVFCIRGQDDDWTRCLTCGICWLGATRIAVHTKQFASMIGKSKSSVNNVFLMLNYASVPVTSADAQLLQSLIPFLKSRSQELRHWAVREEQRVETGEGIEETDELDFFVFGCDFTW
jgi:hypothetical protein